jgi:transposase InsO family protein
MAYTTNPRLPRLRAQAVEMVRAGRSVTEVARHFGYTKGAVSKWCRKVPAGGSREIPTESSRPHRHPRELQPDVVRAIIETKLRYRRCGEVVRGYLLERGIPVSLNSVKRKLDQAGLTRKRSPWKRLHLPIDRPEATRPGDLVQVDTVHLMETPTKRMYVYTLIDVYSRWTYAWATEKIGATPSVRFLEMAQAAAPFQFRCVQSDNGSEFSQWFTEHIKTLHRHSRVRKPNDNAHLERFNRTLQEECIDHVPNRVEAIQAVLPGYLAFYNTERLHLGLALKTPAQMLR